MKKFSFLVTAGLFASNFAHAIVVPGWERPIMEARLTAVGDTVDSPELRALQLTMNRRDGKEAATSFTLLEDTGIRCIKAPCPSTKNTQFLVTGVHASFHNDSVRYEAVEKLKIRPNVRMAPRHLYVTETSMELVAPGGNGFIRRTYWNVDVESFTKPLMTYAGRPKGVVTIQSADVDGIDEE